MPKGPLANVLGLEITGRISLDRQARRMAGKRAASARADAIADKRMARFQP